MSRGLNISYSRTTPRFQKKKPLTTLPLRRGASSTPRKMVRTTSDIPRREEGRWNFPELKRMAFEQFEYWEPDMVLIEAKASGLPLADELMRINICCPPIVRSPKKGGGR